MAVDPEHRYSSEAEKATWDIYVKFEKKVSYLSLYKKNSALFKVTMFNFSVLDQKKSKI